MEIQFKLLKKQIQNVQQAFEIKEYFLKKQWLNGLKALADFGFPEHKELSDSAESDIRLLMELFLKENPIGFEEIQQYHYQNMDCFLHLKEKWDSIQDTQFDMEMSQNVIGEFNNMLDFVTRMACGQWDRWAELLHWFKKDEIYLYPYLCCSVSRIDRFRNRICPHYGDKDLYPGASFGIHSKAITEEIRSLYDIYKVMMYENNQGGVYAYYPRSIAHGYPKPEIQFPYQAEYAYEGNEQELKCWIENLKKPSKNVMDWGQNKDILLDDGQYWFPLGDGKWQCPREGDTIFQTYNGYYVIQREDVIHG